MPPYHYQRNWRPARPLDRGLMLELLEKNDDVVLRTLNAQRNGLGSLLKSKASTAEDIEVIVSLIAKACHSKNSVGIMRLFRIIFSYSENFLRRVPPLIHHSLVKKFQINLPDLVKNYIFILNHILKKKIESFTVIRDISHQLQNYINRMTVMKMKHINEIIAQYQELEKDLEKYEELHKMQLAVNEEPPDDFRQLSVMPRQNDIINCPVPFLRPNVIDGPYSTVDHYLDVHFRLMREDMLRLFRKAVSAFRHRISNKQMQLDDACIYQNVTVHHPCEYTPYGIFYNVRFKTPKVIDWKLTKSFIPGSLVCLTHDKFQTVAFAVVKDRQPQLGSSRDCQLKVMLENPEDELPERCDFIMIETTAYFEPYKHVLSAIQEFNESNFPLSDSIVYLDFEDTDTSYLENIPFCLHEQCPNGTPSETLDENHPCKVFNVLDLDQWPTADELKLDQYQHQAFQTALSKNISLIQGPPGTGKTFLGIKIVKALLDNVQDGPIVISCFTNHALDQFLEHILPFTNKVVRLGNQGKSEILKPHLLSNLLSVVRQYRLDREGVFFMANPVFAKTFEIIKLLVPDILNLGNAPGSADDAELFVGLRRACDDIKDFHSLLKRAEKEYFDADVLNAMIDSHYKQQFSKGEGSDMNVLSRNVKAWLDKTWKKNKVPKNSKSLYESCNIVFSKIEDAMKNVESSEEEEESGEPVKLWELPPEERFRIFYCWKKKCIKILKQKLADEISIYRELLRKITKPQDPDTYAFIKNACVVGMTTTGAAKFLSLMKAVKPRVIIIEEAAEVLESHVMASLVPSIEHVILIGDHEQLRPLPADHDLASNYNLNISLFERLFKNDAPSATLCSQHRMRPCIAELLVSDIYETLLHHDSVSLYENVKGMKNNMFFVQHSEVEDVTSFGKSFSNEHEARFIVELTKYLIHQGYDESQITVLTTYGGQQSQILKYAADKFSGVLITTVDNYQGEENDIILISFVRSNPSGGIGFLAENNRVCVAVSRARKGLYCIGNFEQYARKSSLWSSVVNKLKGYNAFGKELPLQCQNHSMKVMDASEPSDFMKWISNGCGLPCTYMLPCGHTCTSTCHLDDPDHVDFRCQQVCERTIYVDGKPKMCKKRCCDPCETKRKKFIKLPCGHRVPARNEDTIDILLSRYKCTVNTTKRLPCGHLDSSVPCYVSTENHQCNALVQVILNCGHEKLIPCHKKAAPGTVLCQELKTLKAICGHDVDVLCDVSADDEDTLLSYCRKPCDILLNCGHPCTGYCKWCFGTNIHAMCIAPCDKRLPCGHQCEGKCNAPCLPCRKPCVMRCPHSDCVNPCERPCVKCMKHCSWQCDHGKCYASCSEECADRPCNEPCSSVIGCGHPCIGFCGEPCPYYCRICQRDLLHCENPENDRFVLLEDCDHIVEVNKLSAHIDNKIEIFEWPDCPVCSKIITHSTRYSKQLKAAKEMALASANIERKIPELFFHLHTIFGDELSVAWRFHDVQGKIQKILMHEKPSPAAASVLENCLLLLGDLVLVDKKLSEVDDCFGLDGMLETLIHWICNHLTEASYQQISEVEMAVEALKDKVKESFGE